MINQKIYDHVKAYNESEDLDTTDDEIIETIRDGELVWSGYRDSRRWWDDCFTVVKVNGMLIGFDDAETTGDDSPQDKGWEFDPNSICEVEEKQIVTTVFSPLRAKRV